MRLLVISHTPHYRSDSGEIRGWGPTIREINSLTEIFDEVRHIAPLYSGQPPLSALPYDDRVRFISIEPTGGDRISEKIQIVRQAINTIRLVKINLAEVDVFQFRAPTGIGVYLIPWLSLFSRRKGWFKYAGNWNEAKLPLSYRWQRFLLSAVFKKRKVTINGKWPGQPAHVLSFENPALTAAELELGNRFSLQKNFSAKLIMLFVGRIEKAKGVDKAFQLFAKCSPTDFKELVVVGDGDKGPFTKLIESCAIPIRFTGGLPREEINRYYEVAHILLLPSTSEGFPKVISEAIAFGCVPAVSNVSAISQYIDGNNGLLFSSLDPVRMVEELTGLISDRNRLKELSVAAAQLGFRFTYSYYHTLIKEKILEDN